MTKQEQNDESQRKDDKSAKIQKVEKKPKTQIQSDSDSDSLLRHMHQMHKQKELAKNQGQNNQSNHQQNNTLNPSASKTSHQSQQPLAANIPITTKPNPPTSTQTVEANQTKKVEPTQANNQNSKPQPSNNIFESIQGTNQTSQQNTKLNATNVSSSLPKKQQVKNEEKIKQEEKVKKQEKTKKQQQPAGYLRKLHLDPQIVSPKYKIEPIKRLITYPRPNQSPFFKNQMITFMSWNVWKEAQNLNPSNKDSRYREIIRVIKEKNPNIVCLQQAEEFRLTYLAEFLQTDGRHYYYSNSSKYSTIILTRMKVDFYEVTFPIVLRTKAMTLCQFQMMGSDGKMRSVIVHSVHLKRRAENTTDTRKYQLEAIERISKKHDIVIMAGDYNIDDENTDNRLIKYKHLDLQLHKRNPNEVDEQEPTEQEIKRQYRPKRTKSTKQNQEYMQEEYVEEIIHEEQVIEYEFDSNQSSFDGYSDSWYDSDGNPYESSSDQSERSEDDQFGYSQGDDDGSDQYGDSSDAMGSGGQYQDYDSHPDDFQSEPSEDQDDSHAYQSDDNSWEGSDDQGSYDEMEQLRQRPYDHYECHLRGGGGGKRGFDQDDYRRRRSERQRSREKHPTRITSTKTTTKKMKRTLKKINKKSSSHSPSEQMNRKQSSKSKSHRKPPNDPKEFREDKPDDIWTYMYYPKKDYHRFDRILISHKNMSKQDLRGKVNVTNFERLGKYCVGKRYQGHDYRMYFHDKKVRTPSDHLGVMAQFWLNFPKSR